MPNAVAALGGPDAITEPLDPYDFLDGGLWSRSFQQSLGAVVRAIPGVVRLEFELRYQPAAGGAGA